MHNAYGARSLLHRYTGVSTRTLKRLQLVWQHGWIPDSVNVDPDVVISESAETSVYPEWSYLVARKEQERFLAECGVTNARATGLPFAYALHLWGDEYEREKGSLLVVAAASMHVDSSGSVVNLDEAYISYLSQYLPNFSRVAVMLRMRDFTTGRDVPWRQNGYQVIVGAGEADSKSLRRMVEIYSTFEVVTTNGFGSAIAYAASAGCRVSISGPRANPPAQRLASIATVLNRPDLLPIFTKWFHPDRLEESVPVSSLYEEPLDAKKAREWGLKEIGYQNILTPDEFRELLYAEKARQNNRRQFHNPFGQPKSMRALLRELSLVFVGFDSSKFLSPSKVLRNLVSVGFGRRSTQLLPLQGDFGVFWFRARTESIQRMWSLFRAGELGRFAVGEAQRMVVVGCSGGAYFHYWKSVFPRIEILGIEPDERDLELCESNAKSFDGIGVIGPGSFQDFSANRGGSTGRATDPFAFGEVTKATHADQIPPLNEILRYSEWTKSDIVAIDIGGAEYALLLDWAETLRTSCRFLLVRFHHRLARRREYDEVVEKISLSAGEVEGEDSGWVLFRFRGETASAPRD